MLNNGLLWLNYDGTIRGVNYSSKFERAEQKRLLQLRDELREQERSKLYHSLREYTSPVLDWNTDSYRIRIDQIHDKEYGYAAWKADASHGAKPDIVLYNGIEQRCGMECCGSCGGGDIIYGFTNGEYLYEVATSYCHCGKQDGDNPFNLRV